MLRTALGEKTGSGKASDHKFLAEAEIRKERNLRVK